MPKVLEPAWNSAFEEYVETGLGERKVEPRNRIWATELGKSPIDVFLKMKGITPTNFADVRSHRKFEAGDIWESIIAIVLKRAGILIEAQSYVTHQYDGLLQVSGKADFTVGGKVDWLKAKELIDSNEFDWLPDRTKFATRRVIEYLSVTYPEGMPKMILEIKATSGFMYDSFLNTGASENHILQIFHYLKSTGIESGNIAYIDKDSARIVEYEVLRDDPVVEALYKQRIETISKYYENNINPPLENFISFNENRGKFTTNWKVVYSEYLTMLYVFPHYRNDQKVEDFLHSEEVRDVFDSKVVQFNSLMKRMATDAKMTPKNLEWLESIKEMYTDDEIDNFVSIVRSKLDDLKEEENAIEE